MLLLLLAVHLAPVSLLGRGPSDPAVPGRCERAAGGGRALLPARAIQRQRDQ
jgi:hypothetical protein